ncbi:MAG: RusA family crossover junction endodeoxyribonuclease, partial [Aestuariivirgaceae bacterium]
AQVIFTITPPPSANAIWRNVKGRTLKSRVYRQWLKSESWTIATQRKGKTVEGPCTVVLSMRRPRANADLDNRIKPVLDCLEAGGAIVDDKQVETITAAWADHDGCRVEVTQG